MDLIDFLRRKLAAEDLALLKAEIEGAGEVDYEAVIRRVALKLRNAEELFGFARSRLARFDDLLDLPAGRRLTIFRNCSPVVLLVMFRQAVAQCLAERSGDRGRSRQLAEIALEVAEAVAASDYLASPDSEDVLGEAHIWLGNARRLNSDMRGAELALKKAGIHLAKGTGDRELKAEHLAVHAVLRVTQGRSPAAAQLMDQSLAIRRILGDKENLGFALVQRGWIASLGGDPIAKVIDLIQAAMPLINDHQLMLQAVHCLAELLARGGFGYQALKFLGSVQWPLYLAKEEWYRIEHAWIEGIACRTLNELEDAESLLRRVREDLIQLNWMHKLAIASLDLAGVHAAQGKLNEMRQLAEEAHTIFSAEGLEERALSAVLVLQEAIEAERVSEGLAVAVANFLSRFAYNKTKCFEWKEN